MNQFLIFMLGQDKYAVPIHQIQEIRSVEFGAKFTHFAGAPEYVAGVLHLNNTIVPIIDLNRFYFRSEKNQYKAVIILNLDDLYLGILVDGVVDIVELKPDQIKATPDFRAIQKEFIQGVGLVNEEVIILLELNQLKIIPPIQFPEVAHENG